MGSGLIGATNIIEIAVQFVKTDKGGKRPRMATGEAAGNDVHALGVTDAHDKQRRLIHHLKKDGPWTLTPCGTDGDTALFVGGIKFAFEFGYLCHVDPRSGLASKDRIELGNSPGTIDSDYRGEIGILLTNKGKKPFKIKYGMRVAQLVFSPLVIAHFREVDELPPTTRDAGGFGSTGYTTIREGDTVFRAMQRSVDTQFMLLALAQAQRSTCMRGVKKDKKTGEYLSDHYGNYHGRERKYGCVIVQDGRVIGTGYNHEKTGLKPCALEGCMRDQLGIPSGTRLEECRAIHAEEDALNMILSSGQGGSTRGATVYINAEPCLNCAYKLLHAGIKTFVVLEGSYPTNGMKIIKKHFTIIRTVKFTDLSRLATGISFDLKTLRRKKRDSKKQPPS